jgi:hypothetical protein
MAKWGPCTLVTVLEQTIGFGRWWFGAVVGLAQVHGGDG